MYFHPKPSINISAVSLPQNLSYVEILYVHSRDLSHDKPKQLHNQRIADMLNHSPFLEVIHSFIEDCGCYLMLHNQGKSQPRFHASTSLSHLKPAETAIMGYFLGGSIANNVQ